MYQKVGHFYLAGHYIGDVDSTLRSYNTILILISRGGVPYVHVIDIIREGFALLTSKQCLCIHMQFIMGGGTKLPVRMGITGMGVTEVPQNNKDNKGKI